jgi:putative membrane protein
MAAALITWTAALGAVQESPSRSTPDEDEIFLKEAAGGALAEVKLGQIALERASDPQVKAFAQRMLDDHTRAKAELAHLAVAKHIELPDDVETKQQAMADRLGSLSGSNFDRAYVDAMLDDHEEDVEHFKHKASTTQDAAIKAWVSRTLPTLETHLRLARDLHDRLGSATSENKDK